MAPGEALRAAARPVAASVYVVLAHALLVAWLHPSPWVSQALEAVLAAAAAWALVRALDGRWMGAALVGLLAEVLRWGLLAGLGDRPNVGGMSLATVLAAAAAALAQGRRRG
jgi:hypothetical protein